MSFFVPKTATQAALYPGLPTPKDPKINLPDTTQPAASTIDDAAAAAERQAAELRKRKGSGSTILTGAQGDTAIPVTATKALLGS